MANAPMIYFAGKLSMASQFRSFIKANSLRAIQCCRWIDNADMPDTGEGAPSFWPKNYEDIRACDILVVLAPEPYSSEQLRGALVETGYAMALGKIVIAVGDHPGTWVYGGGVFNLPSMDAFRDFLIGYTFGK